MALLDDGQGLELVCTIISRDGQTLEMGERLPKGEFAYRRSAKNLDIFLSVAVGSESRSIGSDGSLVIFVGSLLISISCQFVTSLSDPDSERLNSGGRKGLSHDPRVVVSLPSTESSNEVAKDLAEKEVFGDVQADEVVVVEDDVDVELSKKPRSLAGSDSEVLCCAGCPR